MWTLSTSTLVGWGEPEFEFELLEAFRLALRSTLMTPSEVRAAGSSPLLVLMFLSALRIFRHDISRWSSAMLYSPVVAEQVDDVEMVPLGGPVEGSPPVDVVLRVHVDAP